MEKSTLSYFILANAVKEFKDFFSNEELFILGHLLGAQNVYDPELIISVFNLLRSLDLSESCSDEQKFYICEGFIEKQIKVKALTEDLSIERISVNFDHKGNSKEIMFKSPSKRKEEFFKEANQMNISKSVFEFEISNNDKNEDPTKDNTTESLNPSLNPLSNDCLLDKVCQFDPFSNPIPITKENIKATFDLKKTRSNELLQLVKKFEEEDKVNIKKRMTDDEMITCGICLDVLMNSDIFLMETCEHVFHTECLIQYFETKVNDGEPFLVCPDAECGKPIPSSDIKELLTIEKYEKYLRLTFQKYVDFNADDVSWCPTPDCQYAFTMEDNENHFICPKCTKEYCMDCRAEFHSGMSCKEYRINNTVDENDVKFEKFVKGKKYKQCSKCKFFVSKNQGCNHMTCRCGHQFCYLCGGNYPQCLCVLKAQEKIQMRNMKREANIAKNSKKRIKKR